MYVNYMRTMHPRASYIHNPYTPQHHGISNTYTNMKSYKNLNLRNKGAPLVPKKACGIVAQLSFPPIPTPHSYMDCRKFTKTDVPMRPIVSVIGSPCYNLAKELARILIPLAGHNGYSEKNSTSFVQTVRESSVTAMDCLVSFDVTNLFTQVPITDALLVIEWKLSQDHSLLNRTTIPIPQLVELTELCLCSSYFQFQDKYYEQIKGAAMGCPLSPIVANLFMENLEDEAIRSAPFPTQVVVPICG